MTAVRTHVFADDGVVWLDRIRRCQAVVGEHAETCGLPLQNRVHDVPDVTEQQDEHRRRGGEN